MNRTEDAMRAMYAALLVLGACSGPSDDGDIPPNDTVPPPPDDTGTTTETGIEGGSINPAFWAVTGRFAFDQTNVEHRTYAIPGVGLASIQLEFMLIDATWGPANPVLDDETRCLVIFEWDTRSGIADWAEPHGGWTGLDLPSTATVRDQCSEFYGLPPDWSGDVASHLKNWTWGVGVGPLTDYMADVLRTQLPASQWAAIEDFAVGGLLNTDFLVNSDISEDGFTDLGFTLGYLVDSNFEIVIGGTGSKEPISKDYINKDPGVHTGYYEVTLGPYTPAQPLTTGGGD